MAFVRIGPEAARVAGAGVVISLNKPPSGKCMNLRIRVGPELIEQLGWVPGQKIELCFGEDEDAGRALLRRAEPGHGVKLIRDRKVPEDTRASCDASFGWLPTKPYTFPDGRVFLLSSNAVPAVRPAYTVAGDGLLVVLPDQWWVPAGAQAKAQLAPLPAGKPNAVSRPQVDPRASQPSPEPELWRKLALAGETEMGMKAAGLSLRDIARAKDLQREMRRPLPNGGAHERPAR